MNTYEDMIDAALEQIDCCSRLALYEKERCSLSLELVETAKKCFEAAVACLNSAYT